MLTWPEVTWPWPSHAGVVLPRRCGCEVKSLSSHVDDDTAGVDIDRIASKWGIGNGLF
jgi:hypothetical protein